MKLSISLAILSFTSCSALKVNEAFLNEQEIDQFRGRLPKIDKQRHTAPLAVMESASLSSEYCAPHALVGLHGRRVCANKDVDFDLEVRTSLIDRSTQEHVDHYSNGDKVHEDVGFVFLNTNPDAHFQHGEDVVPIKAGNLVTFKGDVSHNTVVKSGQVHLLGPFDMVNFKGVGGGTNCCGIQS